MATADEKEERSVSLADLKAGVKLKAGHAVVLLFGGAGAAPAGDGDGSSAGGAGGSGAGEDGSGDTAPSGAGGEGGSDAAGDDSSGAAGSTAAGADDATGTGGSAAGDPTGGDGSAAGDPTGGDGSAAGGATGGEEGGDDGDGSAGTTPPKAPASLLATLEDPHFEFDKTFPLPSAIAICRDIARQVAKAPPAHVLVVGHADTVGKAAYNKALSKARAQNIAALLHDTPADVDRWLAQYQAQPAGKPWGAREDQHMLTALPHCGPKYFDGPVGNAHTNASRAALKKFQHDQGVKETGTPDGETRRRLILDYMNSKAADVPESIPLSVLGASFFHSLGGAAADDRRVDVFLFVDELVPDPAECDGAAATKPPAKHCDAYDAWKKEVTGAVPHDPDDGCGSHPTGNLLLTTGTVLLCPHGGTVQASAPSTRAQAGGQPLLPLASPYTVSGCALPTPCAAVTWVSSTVRTLIEGVPVLTSGSLGLCRDAGGQTQGIVQITNPQARVAAE